MSGNFLILGSLMLLTTKNLKLVVKTTSPVPLVEENEQASTIFISLASWPMRIDFWKVPKMSYRQTVPSSCIHITSSAADHSILITTPPLHYYRNQTKYKQPLIFTKFFVTILTFMEFLSSPEGENRKILGFPEDWTGVNFLSSLITAIGPPAGATATFNSERLIWSAHAIEYISNFL